VWTLTGPDGRPFRSPVPGALGGHRRGRIYGRLDCPAALRAIARGGYLKQRVFFASEADAVAAGFRPCAVCLPREYAAWRVSRAAPPRADQPANDSGGSVTPLGWAEADSDASHSAAI
jgi:Metal binding domain of Ada